MDTKDSKHKTKTALVNELESIKNTLEDDDDIPVLGNDDDVPLLMDDDDIPVLSAADADHAAEAGNKASLEAALRQLESMELAPKAKPKTSLSTPAASTLAAKMEEHQTELPLNTTANKTGSLEDKIRANASAPLIKDEELAKVRENPFLNQSQRARLDQNKKLVEEAQKATLKTPTLDKPTGMSVKDNPSESPINFVSGKTAATHSSTATNVAHTTEEDEEDASEEILKLLEEEPRVEKDDDEFDIDDELADIDNELSQLGKLIDKKESGSSVVTAKPAPVQKPAVANTISKADEARLDQIVDEVVEEYIIVLEAALKKKLKEKLPHLLK